MTPNDIPTDDAVEAWLADFPAPVTVAELRHIIAIGRRLNDTATGDRPVAHNPQDGCPTCGAPLYYCRAPHAGQRKPGWHCRRDETHNYDVAEKDLR